MEEIISDLIRESIKKYDCIEDMLWGEFTDRIDKESVCDLLEVISFEAIMNHLERQNINYYGHQIIDVCNLYILVVAQEILKRDFPKLYLTKSYDT